MTDIYPCGHPRTDENTQVQRYHTGPRAGRAYKACRACRQYRGIIRRATRKVDDPAPDWWSEEMKS